MRESHYKLKQNNMNAQFTNAVANLTVSDYEHIDQMCLMLKTRKKELRVEKSEILKAEKAAAKSAQKAEKDALKAAEKADKEATLNAKKAAEKAEKDALKAAEKAQKDALKAAEKAEKDAKKAEEKAERDAKKAEEKAKKDAKKTAEKAEKDSAKKAEKAAKTLEKLQTAVLKNAKKDVAGSPKAKNWAYQNFTRWAQGEDGPSEEEISSAGGRREWLKSEWATLTTEQRGAEDAPWNVIA